ncbi:MAG TPA: response regulator [Nitrospiraceae bacterium]|nr:response regulator [Nitrospiraceae bacterium]
MEPSHDIVLVDAHFRDRLKKRLEKITGVHVVGESSDSEETTPMILNRKPDIAILNSSLRDGRAIEALRHIKQLMVPSIIIVVTDDPSRDNETACTLAGADFLFDKATEDHKMINTVCLLYVPHSRIEASDLPIATLDECSA